MHLFYFRLNFVFLHSFKLFEPSRYMIIHQIKNLCNFDSFRNCKISEIFEIWQFDNFRNFRNWEIKQISRFISTSKTKVLLQKLAILIPVRPFDISYFSQFRQFLYLPFNTNNQFLFPILETRKFGRSTFKHSLIFKIETLAIPKFYCLKC